MPPPAVATAPPVALLACPAEGAVSPDGSAQLVEGLKDQELTALLERICSRLASRALRRNCPWAHCPWAPTAADLVRWLRARAPRDAVHAVLDRVTAASDLRACGSLAATCVALRDASTRSADWLERLVLLRFLLLEALRRHGGDAPLGSARDMFMGQAGVVRAFRFGAPLRSAALLDDVVFALDIVIFEEVSETSQRSLHSCRGTVVQGTLETTIEFAVPQDVSARAALASERGKLELRVLATRLGGRARAVEHAVLYDGMFSDYDGEALEFESRLGGRTRTAQRGASGGLDRHRRRPPISARPETLLERDTRSVPRLPLLFLVRRHVGRRNFDDGRGCQPLPPRLGHLCVTPSSRRRSPRPGPKPSTALRPPPSSRAPSHGRGTGSLAGKPSPRRSETRGRRKFSANKQSLRADGGTFATAPGRSKWTALRGAPRWTAPCHSATRALLGDFIKAPAGTWRKSPRFRGRH
ncbi:hypothetical protein M885DRAFT_552471 [Pelagophyceae sp. CCMP2097]|nr:hypothetical protein M885DRAFT_552471 [Pelagophyceae sp. CCMP2097]